MITIAAVLGRSRTSWKASLSLFGHIGTDDNWLASYVDGTKGDLSQYFLVRNSGVSASAPSFVANQMLWNKQANGP